MKRWESFTLIQYRNHMCLYLIWDLTLMAIQTSMYLRYLSSNCATLFNNTSNLTPTKSAHYSLWWIQTPWFKELESMRNFCWCTPAGKHETKKKNGILPHYMMLPWIWLRQKQRQLVLLIWVTCVFTVNFEQLINPF